MEELARKLERLMSQLEAQAVERDVRAECAGEAWAKYHHASEAHGFRMMRSGVVQAWELATGRTWQ